jgi:hypothetical protein
LRFGQQRRGPRLAAGLAIAAAAAAGCAEIAVASTAPKPADAKSIKRGFLKDREVETQVGRIRLSSVDDRYASVSYSVTIPELSSSRPVVGRLAPEGVKAPSPALLKEAKGKWKPVPKAPAKVKKDLKKKAKSDIVITGDVVAVLSRGASCSPGRMFYSAGILDPGSGTYLSLEFPSFRGPGVYPALGVHSVAALSVNNNGVPQYTTGQGNDAFSPSGFLYVDRDGWGLIGATMAKEPDEGGTYPQSVEVEGHWVCR